MSVRGAPAPGLLHIICRVRFAWRGQVDAAYYNGHTCVRRHAIDPGPCPAQPRPSGPNGQDGSSKEQPVRSPNPWGVLCGNRLWSMAHACVSAATVPKLLDRLLSVVPTLLNPDQGGRCSGNNPRPHLLFRSLFGTHLEGDVRSQDCFHLHQANRWVCSGYKGLLRWGFKGETTATTREFQRGGKRALL